MKSYLITGCYGFLGFHLAQHLLDEGHQVVGIDRLIDAHSPKAGRVELLAARPGFTFHEANIASWPDVERIFSEATIDDVMHFAAQYAVLHKPEHVRSYAQNNCVGFLNIIEAARLKGLKRFHYASSTFVEDGALPSSLYGATKQFNELSAHVYSNAHKMTTVGIRYGSTFGPWCRPDVGIHQLARKVLNKQHIRISSAFHYQTAFLYSQDAVDVTAALLKASLSGFNVFTPVAEDHRHDLGEILHLLERHLGKANCDWRGYKEKPAGGIPQAQCDALRVAIGFAPRVSVADGVAHFCAWAKGRHAEGKL